MAGSVHLRQVLLVPQKESIVQSAFRRQLPLQYCHAHKMPDITMQVFAAYINSFPNFQDTLLIPDYNDTKR